MDVGVQFRALVIAAVVLIALFFIGDQLGYRTNSREPRTHVMVLDTGAIVSINFEDRAEPANNLHYQRIGDEWPLSISERQAPPATELLRRFQRIPVKREMGMIKLLGERYDLMDGTLCKFTFTSHDGREQVLHVGSSTFAPGKVGAWTYVNVPGEREVYAVEGLLLQGLRWKEASSHR